MEHHSSPRCLAMEQSETPDLQRTKNQGEISMHCQENEQTCNEESVELEKLEPYVGMQFDSLDDARNFYENYGRQEGFWIRTRSTTKGRWHSNEVTSALYVCAREGKYNLLSSEKIAKERIMEELGGKERANKTVLTSSTVKGGCRASMRVSLNKWTQKWTVKTFEEMHNHKLVTPRKRMKMMSNITMSKATIDLPEVHHRASLPIGKVSSISEGAQIECDIDHFKDNKHRNLEGGDAQSMLTYEQTFKKIVRMEKDEGFESKHDYCVVGDDEFLLKHAAKVYRRNIFYKFKEEWTQRNMYKVEVGESDVKYSTFVVVKKIGKEKFVVKLNLQTLEGNCECKYFELMGILCRHMLKVFYRFDIDEIPDHFILPRWKQDLNKFRLIDGEEYTRIDSNEEFKATRLSYLCQEADKLALIASHSKKGSVIFIEGLNEISKKLTEAMDEDVENEDENEERDFEFSILK